MNLKKIVSDILRESYIKELKNLEKGLKKISELQQPSEEEDCAVSIRKYKNYIDKERIQIKF